MSSRMLDDGVNASKALEEHGTENSRNYVQGRIVHGRPTRF